MERSPTSLRAVILAVVVAALCVLPGLSGGRSAEATGTNTIASPDGPNSVGQESSVAVDSSGNPVVSYWDSSAGSLVVLHCGNPSCTMSNSISAPDTGSVGRDSSIKLDASGNPVVSYWDYGSNNLKLLHCGNSTCTAGNSIKSPDASGTVGGFTSLALDSNGYPLVSYYGGASDLKVLHCNDVKCDALVNGAESIQTPVSAGIVGIGSSVIIENAVVQSRAIVSYGDVTNSDVNVLVCSNLDCTSIFTTVSVSTTTAPGGPTSIVISPYAQKYVIAFQAATTGSLMVATCGQLCQTFSPAISVDGNVYGRVSAALGRDYLPIIAYWTSSSADLHVVHCASPGCDHGLNLYRTMDSTGDVGQEPFIAIDNQGRPVVSYWDATNADLKVLHCGDSICLGAKQLVDSDGDALPDYWETTGDINGDSVMDINLPAMGADPGVKDVFVETDWVDCPGGGCAPGNPATAALEDQARSELIAYFWCAPERIVLHIDAGPGSVMDPTVDGCTTRRVTGPLWGSEARGNAIPATDEFYTVKAGNFDFTNRSDIFHYAYLYNSAGPYGFGFSMGIPASDFEMTMAAVTFPTNAGIQRWQFQVSTFIHELGHNLGLHHGGDVDTNYKPNYLSIMSYSAGGLGTIVNRTTGHYDYSREALDALNEASLNEAVGLDPDAAVNAPDRELATIWPCANGGGSQTPMLDWGAAVAHDDVDWDCDGAEDGVVSPPGTCVDTLDNGPDGARDQADLDCASSIEPSVAVDINADYQLSLLTGYDDWSNLVFGGGIVGMAGAQTARHDRGLPHTDEVPGSQLPIDADGDGLVDAGEAQLGTSPTDPDDDNDGVTDGLEVGTLITNPKVPDSDGDGCTEGREMALTSGNGGLRNPAYFWDFYDVWTRPNPIGQPNLWVRDRVVNIPGDIVGVASRFGATDAGGTAPVNRNSDPLVPPTSPTGYHPSFDRGSVNGIYHWSLGPADGAINVPNDVLGVAKQFGHSCL